MVGSFWFFKLGESISVKRGPHGEVANVLDCDIVVSEFELQLRYYIHFRTNTHGGKVWLPLSSPAMCQILPLLFFY